MQFRHAVKIVPTQNDPVFYFVTFPAAICKMSFGRVLYLAQPDQMLIIPNFVTKSWFTIITGQNYQNSYWQILYVNVKIISMMITISLAKSTHQTVLDALCRIEVATMTWSGGEFDMTRNFWKTLLLIFLWFDIGDACVHLFSSKSRYIHIY